MTNTIEIRPATRNDLEAVERLKIKIFSSNSNSAMSQLPLEVQVKVRLALNEATGNLPEQVFVAFDGSRLVGVTSFETTANSRLPRWKNFSILWPLGFLGILRLLFVIATSYYPSDPREAYFYGTSIESDYRRRGIAKQLRMAAEKQAIRMGKDLAVVIVSHENIASLKLAKKLGYYEVARPRNFLRTLFLGSPKFIRLEKQIVPHSSNKT